MAMAERQHPEHAPKRRSKGGKGHGPELTVRPQAAQELMRRRHSERRVAIIPVTGGDQIVLLEHVSTLLGGRRVLGSMIESEMDAHELLHRGLPRAALSKLVDNLHVIQVDEATEALGMSVRTLQRHKNTPVVLLDVQQSGRTWKFAEILAKATRVLGSQEEAEQWLRRPAIGLDQKRPIDLLTTPAGVQLVEDYLGRLEYDVYT
jgi:putative toxin-antitoxin system antitoxin component (TIGR02293 family)